MNSAVTRRWRRASAIARVSGNHRRRSSNSGNTSSRDMGVRRETKSGASGKSNSSGPAGWSCIASVDSGAGGVGDFFIQFKIAIPLKQLPPLFFAQVNMVGKDQVDNVVQITERAMTEILPGDVQL